MTRPLFYLVVVGGTLVGSPGGAQEKIPLPSSPASLPAAEPGSCPGPCVPMVEKTIGMRKVYLVEEQAATTLPDFKLRDVECGKGTCLELDWREEKRVCTELVLKPREIEQEVTCLTVQPVTTIDPCTGHPCTVHQQVPVVKKVKLTVYDAVPEEKEYVVKIPCLKPVDVVVKRLAVDWTTEPAIEKRLRAVTVPCEIKVRVPAWPTPCPPR